MAEPFQQGAARHHKQGCRHALVRDIGDDEADAAVFEGQDVEEVAADVARGLHAAKNFKALTRWGN